MSAVLVGSLKLARVIFSPMLVLRLLRRLDAAGQRVILHVHDEIVLEADDTEVAAEALAQVMTTAPAWAAGLPLAAEVNIRERYGK